MPPTSRSGMRARRSAAVAGIVVSHAMPMSRTIRQRTWCQRRRPAPMPTIDDETTCDVEIGAPRNDAPEDDRRRAGLAREAVQRRGCGRSAARSSERSSSRRRPSRASARRPQPTVTQSGAASDWVLPAARSMRRDEPDRLLGVVGAVAERERGGADPLRPVDRRRAAARSPRRRPRRRSRRTRKAATPPRTGETAMATRVPITPTGPPAVEAAPVDRARRLPRRAPRPRGRRRAPAPSSTAGRATRSGGSRTVAPISPAPITAIVSSAGT